MLYPKRRPENAVMSVYRPSAIFPLLLHLLYACHLWLNVVSLLSLQINVYTSMNISLSVEHPCKRVLLGKNVHTDILLLTRLFKCFLFCVACFWSYLISYPFTIR